MMPYRAAIRRTPGPLPRPSDARALDAGAIGAILSDHVDDSPWLPRIHSRAQEIGFAAQMIERGWVRVLRMNGVVAGFIARQGDEIHALYMARLARGAGLGQALLADARASRDRLALWCYQADPAALRFYRREAFREVARTDGAGNDAGLPDIRMVWQRKEPET